MREKGKKFPWFLAAVLLICLWPVYALPVRNKGALSGSIVEQPFPEFSVGAVLDGSWQDGFNAWWQQHLPGNGLLIRLRNEFVYTVLRTSPNANVLIGRKGGLYERLYLDDYCNYPEPPDADTVAGQVEKLEQFRDLLAEHGKSMYVFVTPSKVRFMPDDLPWYYNTAMHKVDGYELLRDALSKSDLQVFDAVAYLQQNPGLLPAPYFYPTGIHWDTCWAASATIQLLDLIEAGEGRELGTMTLQCEPTTERVEPNKDLEELLNRLYVPHFLNYRPIVEQTPAGGPERPGLFAYTGSFGYTSLRLLTSGPIFGPSVYFENQKLSVRDADGTVTDSIITDYSQMDLQSYLAQTDIFIVEILEIRSADIAEGLTKYIMEHPELLDAPA